MQILGMVTAEEGMLVSDRRKTERKDSLECSEVRWVDKTSKDSHPDVALPINLPKRIKVQLSN